MFTNLGRYFRSQSAVASASLTMGAMLFASASARGQTTPLLSVQYIQAPSAGLVSFVFTDVGTGATNYWIESSPEAGPSAIWQVATNAVIVPQGGAFYEVMIDAPPAGTSFFRVVGSGGSAEPIIIQFSETGYFATEGGQLWPMLLLDRPFLGTIHYRVEGTGDYVPLSGELQVEGTTAVIPLLLHDNAEIGRLTYLSLILENGPGYQVGPASRTTVTIDENDARWEGEFYGEGGSVQFALTMVNSAGLISASLQGDEFGFLPTNQVPATVSFTPDTFSATASSIPISAEATLLDSALDLSLYLGATNGVPEQTVTEAKVLGLATLITRVPAMPYLDTTNQGTFLILKPRVAPATDDGPFAGNP